MINSFWNICSTCPMPREEKLNSEYKRNYVWHPQYKPLAQDVISCAPQSVSKELGIQRKKQYPDLAYRSHEVIGHDAGPQCKDTVDLRARSEERESFKPAGLRSRSAEPRISQQAQKMIMIQSFPPIASGRVSMLPNTEEFPNIAEQPSETSEYQSQFAWPRKGTEGAPSCMARKSVSMSIIKGLDETDSHMPKTKLAPIHRQCMKHKKEEEEKSAKEIRKLKTEYKSKYKPFTSYVYVDGQWKKTSRLLKVPEKGSEHLEPWFVEVAERLQKANEYRWRGHGHPVYGELLPDIYKKLPDVSTPRPKIVASENLIPQPKCHQVKRGESVKREIGLEPIAEKRREEKSRKTPPQQRRPKSAEPAKAKEYVKQKRPATTPPSKSTPRASSTHRRTPKEDDGDKASKSRSASTKKVKDASAKAPSSASKKTRPSSSASQSSGGKVWLQPEKTALEPRPGDKPLVPETSDAVRPSSLSPIPPAKVAPETKDAKELAKSPQGNLECTPEVKSAVPQSVVPLTNVRTPEEVTGVKSPDPENWTVPIENSEKLQWSKVQTKEKEPICDLPTQTGQSESLVSVPKCDASIEPEKSAEVTEKSMLLPASEETVPNPLVSQTSTEPSSSKLTSANVLDRARSRLDQFWGKNK